VSVLTLDGISQAAALGVYVARRQAGDMLDDIFDESLSSSTTAMAPPITRTWCSPLSRCRQTYAAVSGCCSYSSSSSYSSYSSSSSSSSNDDDGRRARSLPDPTIHHDLREIELREWEGRLRHEIEMSPLEIDRMNWQALREDPTSLRLDGGKFAPLLDCWERGVKNWKVIRSDAAASSSFVTPNTDANDDADTTATTASNAARTSLRVEKKDEVDPSGAVFIMCHGALGKCMLLHALGMGIETYRGKSAREYEFDNCDCVEVEWHDDDDAATRWRRVHPGGGGEWRCIR
jgi:broad specificity phosphatase PhoE